MYLIDKEKNKCVKIEQKSFSELGFREREHLQEWLAKNPSMFGEEFLIIQKEFDGFSNTRERLDLLALDKQGNLVIIENKLDDTGRDVVWQSLKYASYCSSLGKEEIRTIFQDYINKKGEEQLAEVVISDFFGKDYEEIILNRGNSQRIILVAANFRKEVTSTVLWLMNYNLRLQCFKVTPFQNGKELLLDIEQIIPIKDAEEYIIKMAEKSKDDSMVEAQASERHKIREEFWSNLLNKMKSKSDLFRNKSTTKENWIATGAGISGVSYNFAITKSSARIELYIRSDQKEKNKEIFDYMYSNKQTIESSINNKIIWERFEDKDASKLYINIEKNYFEKENWQILIDLLVDNMIYFHKVIDGYLKEFKGKK